MQGLDNATAGFEGERQTLLLFRSQDDGRMALPLAKVSRLEEFGKDKVEDVGGRSVIQYRGQILPLVHIADLIPERRSASRNGDEQGSTSLHVIVFTNGTRMIGLVVNEIIDILEERISLEADVARECVLGSAVIRDRVAELLDIEAVIRRAEPAFFDAEVAPPAEVRE